MFLGLSKGELVSAEMLQGMAANPIVFALANPEPEIPYDIAINAREDIIMATGRSDHPNQVNNVLGFPFIFRGALDVRATAINDEMKLAAVKAIAQLAKETVPDEVSEAYDEQSFVFGRHLIIPKPLDPRLISAIAPAVAKAAMESGVAREPITNWSAYEQTLLKRLGQLTNFSHSLRNRAAKRPKRVVFAEAEHLRVLKAAEQALDEGIAHPILIGRKNKIDAIIEEHSLKLDSAEIINPRSDEELERRVRYGEILFEKRKRNGLTALGLREICAKEITLGQCWWRLEKLMRWFSGLTRNYPNVIRPALHVIGKAEGVNKVAGMYIMQTKQGPMFFGDTTVNVNPTAQDIVEITLLMADAVRRLRLVPRIALLSYSNFGSSKGADSEKMAEAARILHRDHPDLIVDGEIQANYAINGDMLTESFPFSKLHKRRVNTLIFPNLAASNISYKLLKEMGGIEAQGPVLLGMKKSVHILQMGSTAKEILDMVRLAVVEAQNKK